MGAIKTPKAVQRILLASAGIEAVDKVVDSVFRTLKHAYLKSSTKDEEVMI